MSHGAAPLSRSFPSYSQMFSIAPVGLFFLKPPHRRREDSYFFAGCSSAEKHPIADAKTPYSFAGSSSSGTTSHRRSGLFMPRQRSVGR